MSGLKLTPQATNSGSSEDVHVVLGSIAKDAYLANLFTVNTLQLNRLIGNVSVNEAWEFLGKRVDHREIQIFVSISLPAWLILASMMAKLNARRR